MDIFYFNITPLRNKIVFQDALDTIEATRKEKVASFKQTDDKLRCVGAGLLINHIRERYGVTCDILVDRYGKPYFEDNKIYFNISHSGNFVVAAVSNESIGIDIQRTRADKHRIAEKNFLPEECDFINEAADEAGRMERFCQVWTVKEAYLKKIGIGLRKPLKSFKVDMNAENPVIVDEPTVKVIQFKMDQVYVISVCSHLQDIDINVEAYTIK